MSELPFFRDYQSFAQVLADKTLSRPGRAIRVYNYGASSKNEKLYVIGTKEQLFDSDTGLKVEPAEVLSRESAPDGWSVEGLALELLPEEEIKRIIQK